MLEALSLLLILAQAAEPYEVGDDLLGPYCARINKCCQGREDECAVPILNTLCYCDTFCNRTWNEDCCPDYASHCLHTNDYDKYQPFEGREEWTRPRPPAPAPLENSCFFHGRFYPPGETVRLNCNDCKCEVINNKAEMLCESDKCLIDSNLVDMVNHQSSAGQRDRDLSSRSEAAWERFDDRLFDGEGLRAGGKASWTATNYTQFWGRKLEEGLRKRLGTLDPSDAVMNMNPIHHTLDPPKLPLSFDARTVWPGMLSEIQDQGWCGASWALSTVAVASDRYAIMSLGKETPRLAAQHLLDCNNRRQHGCDGGHLDRAWFFTRKFGLVPDSCYPWTGSVDKCHVPKKATLATARCPQRALSSKKARTELYRMGPAYRLAGEENIMREMIRSGPVQATLQVYRDLFSYRSGIYEHIPIAEVERSGYHSVRIVGWGEEEGIKYWVVANSWGGWWGENGYFRIRRGVNECKIEDLVLAAWAHTHVQKELDNSIRT